MREEFPSGPDMRLHSALRVNAPPPGRRAGSVCCLIEHRGRRAPLTDPRAPLRLCSRSSALLKHRTQTAAERRSATGKKSRATLGV